MTLDRSIHDSRKPPAGPAGRPRTAYRYEKSVVSSASQAVTPLDEPWLYGTPVRRGPCVRPGTRGACRAHAAGSGAAKPKRFVRRAATYGWLPRLARDVDEQDEQDYAELSDKFKTMVRHGDIGTVGKRADKVMNQFDSILRPGMARRFSRAAPAIALLREAVERGWKLKLARDVAAMAGTAVESDSDDDLPNMS